ncbi:MAG: hypothetical protein AAB416_02465 [Patescibacteria group bacterium]
MKTKLKASRTAVETDAPIHEQLENYLKALREINDHRLQPRNDQVREITALEFVLGGFLASREMRTADIASPEIQKTIEIKERLFPYGRPKLVLCVDGRVLAKHIAGLHGNSMRLPAGDVKEFVPRRSDGHLTLSPTSHIAEVILKALEGTDQLFEIFDSHVGCAARKLEESDRAGHDLADAGLYQDVLRKREMKRALEEFVAKTTRGEKQIYSIQTSFDPHTGYCFAGLDECLDDPRVQAKGFTEEMLATLVAEGRVLSVHAIVEEERNADLHALFTEYQFELDYEGRYRECSLRFWNAIEAMAPKLVPFFEERLQKAYPQYANTEFARVCRQSAVFLLANAFTAYLNNQKPHYRYSEHDESVIAVTYSEKGPYSIARSFSIDPYNPTLSASIKLTADLIRANRKSCRMSQPEREFVEKLYGSHEEYVKNPVPVIFFERLEVVRSDSEAVRQADWSDLATLPWMTMSEDEFAHYLERKIPDITQGTARAMMRLRARAIELYRPGKPATDSLLEGRIVPVFLLAGLVRETIALLPFIVAGYDV